MRSTRAIDQVVQTIKLRDWINGLAVGGGFLWATVIPDDTLWKIDENGNVDRTFAIGHEPGSVVYFDDAVWVASDGKLSRIDPKTDTVTDYPLVDRPLGLTAGDGALYVTTGESPPKLAPLPADQVATFSLAEDWVDDIDPAHAWPNPYRAQLEYATGRSCSTTRTRRPRAAPCSGRRWRRRCRPCRRTAGRTRSASARGSASHRLRTRR